MAFVLARKVGKRPGLYAPHPEVPQHRSYNLGLTTTGVILVFAGLPMVILSCGFFFAPEAQFVGPFAGYVAGAPAFGIYAPWQMPLVSFFAPLVAYAVYEWSQRREIDEHKLIPLFLGAASYGLLILGVITWGTPQSGYFGVEEGDAYQHAEITLYWQALGLAVSIGAGS
jgi:hypothetical protein